MTIKFECECGQILRAAEELAGRNLECPVCKRPITVPVESTVQAIPTTPNGVREETGWEEQAGGREDAGWEEQIDNMTRQENIESKEPDRLEDTLGGPPQDRSQKMGWFQSRRLLILAGVVFVLLVAVIRFTVMRRGEKVLERVVVIQEDAPLSEKSQNREANQAGTSPETDINPVEGGSVTKSLLTAEEQPVTEEVNEGMEQTATTAKLGAIPVSETSTTEEKESVQDIAEEDAEPEPAILQEEKPESIEVSGPQPGSYTVNLASFRKRERADRYVRELREEGFEAFSWEIDLPEKGKWYRVSVGNFPTLEHAKRFVIQEGLKENYSVFIARIPSA